MEEKSAVYANLVMIHAGPADFLLQFGIKSNRSSPNIPEEDFSWMFTFRQLPPKDCYLC